MTEHTLGDSKFLPLQDGRKLHYQTAGSGGPTVVFESGMGFSSAIWGLVQPDVAAHTRTVVYDRAGAGKSDWDNADRTLDRICDDLDQLLQALPGPFILVGYSWGGPIVRRMVHRRKTDVCAMVLVNQTDEKNSEYARLARKRSRLVKVAILWIMHSKGLRAAAWAVIRKMPTDCRQDILFRDILLRGVKLFLAEGRHFLSGLMEMRKDDDSFAGTDVTVITGRSRDVLTEAYAEGMVKAPEQTVQTLDQGRLVRAYESAHFAPLTQPRLVVKEILKAVEKHRTR